MSVLFETPLDAWRYLIASGGLEPAGRDELLVARLSHRLDASAIDIEAALAKATIERFLNAFFALLTPFANMMRDLLRYFEKAEVTEGPQNWTLLLGGVGEPLQVNLDHFKHWLELFSKNLEPHEVLALPPPVMWTVYRAFDNVREHNENYRLGKIPPAAEPDLRQWLEIHEEQGWLPLPDIVHRYSAQPGAMGDYARFISELAAAFSSVFPNYKTLYGELWRTKEDLSPEVFAYAANEHDRWIQSSVLNLVAFERASEENQLQIQANLNELFRDQPRRQSRFQFSNKTLAEVVSLPIWKKRYELYSAWVFTQILQALRGHNLALHHDHGRLKFAFHETPLATVNSARNPITFFSEKRVPARDLKGHGRFASIQPDYSAWTGDVCPLAVECKHYKRSSINFDYALMDYSQNLPGAVVLLVNYGPIGAHLKAMTAAGGYGGRRLAWGNVNPDFPAQLEEFRKAVRRAIGEPYAPAPSDSASAGSVSTSSAVLLIDISTSMSDVLRTTEAKQYIAEIIENFTPSQLVAVDEDIRGSFEPTDTGLQELLRLHGGGTALLAPARELQAMYTHVFVLTDQEGVRMLSVAADVIRERPLFLVEVRPRAL